MLAWNTRPDDGGDVFIEPYSIKATTGLYPYHVLIFNDSGAKDSVSGVFRVPENYVGTPEVHVEWTSTAIVNEVVFDFDYRAIGGNDVESLDQATHQQSVTVTDTAPSAINEKMTAIFTGITASNFAIGDLVQFLFSRDGVDVADDMAAAAIVHGLWFKYADA